MIPLVMTRSILIVGVLACVWTTSATRQITQYYDTEGDIIADGYYTETHHVTTADGYILEINRIPHGRYERSGNATDSQRPVVLLMHGLQHSAVQFILLGPSSSIAYNLADGGFDVWIATSRGVFNSRNHIKLDPDDAEEKMEFFDFTYEEIAIFDLPAIIDYVLNITGRDKLHYVGHSQGGTVFLVLNSMKPEYNERFLSAHLLAPAGYHDHVDNAIVLNFAKRIDSIYTLTKWRGFVEIFSPSANDSSEESKDDEPGSWNWEKLLNDLLGALLNDEIALFDVIPGASVKQYIHFFQNIRDASFRRWNYGKMMNMIRYGSPEPPQYELSLVTVNVTLHYSVGDKFIQEDDVIAMTNAMTNASARKLARNTFSHTDFIMSADVKELVTEYIIDEIKNNY